MGSSFGDGNISPIKIQFGGTKTPQEENGRAGFVMMVGNDRLIVIVPVYEDVEAVQCLIRDMAKTVFSKVFMIIVDDGSIHTPVEVENLQNLQIEGVVLKLKRNFGHQLAIAIGLGYVAQWIDSERMLVVMDSDGEDLPSDIPQLLNKLDKGGVDVVVAQRSRRHHGIAFLMCYWIYCLCFRLLTGKSMRFGNFMALKGEGVKRLVGMREISIHFAASVLASNLRVDSLQLDRGRRYSGASKMNFLKLVLHGFKSIMVFAEDVLVRVGIASAAVAGMAILGIFLALLLKATGQATPGWFSVALGLLTLTFLQTGILTLIALILTGINRKEIPRPYDDHLKYIDSITDLVSHGST